MNLPTPILLTYGLLAVAVLSAWCAPIKLSGKLVLPPWIVLLAAAFFTGKHYGLLSWQAGAALLVLAALTWAGKARKNGWLKALLLIAAGAMTLALSLHRFPGFVNPALVTELRLSALSPPFTHRLNFDTAAAGLILFAILCVQARTRKDWRAVGQSGFIILVTPALVLAAGLALGFVALDVKWVAYTPIFLCANLLFTCVTEEAFFRGLIQHQLGEAISRWRKAGPYLAVLIAAVLFGIAHARGGTALIVLASVAGVGYGYAYLYSKRIEAAILTHFALNAIHFVAFTYPRAV